MTDEQFIKQLLPHLKKMCELCAKQAHNPSTDRPRQIWVYGWTHLNPLLDRYTQPAQDHTQQNFFDLTEVNP